MVSVKLLRRNCKPKNLYDEFKRFWYCPKCVKRTLHSFIYTAFSSSGNVVYFKMMCTSHGTDYKNSSLFKEDWNDLFDNNLDTCN